MSLNHTLLGRGNQKKTTAFATFDFVSSSIQHAEMINPLAHFAERPRTNTMWSIWKRKHLLSSLKNRWGKISCQTQVIESQMYKINQANLRGMVGDHFVICTYFFNFYYTITFIKLMAVQFYFMYKNHK